MKDGKKRESALLAFFRQHAESKGLTVKQAFDRAYDGFENDARRDSWGPMPSEYDPSKDQSHPGKGWASK